MKTLNKSQLNELGRIEEKGWEIVTAIVENAIIIETDNAIRYDIPADQRAHACGKVEALKDLAMVLKSERGEALVRLGRILKTDD
jgi:hypothetical protein